MYHSYLSGGEFQHPLSAACRSLQKSTRTKAELNSSWRWNIGKWLDLRKAHNLPSLLILNWSWWYVEFNECLPSGQLANSIKVGSCNILEICNYCGKCKMQLRLCTQPASLDGHDHQRIQCNWITRIGNQNDWCGRPILAPSNPGVGRRLEGEYQFSSLGS